MGFESRPDGRPVGMTRVRHVAGFIASGLLAFSVDAGVLALGTKIFGLNPLVARVGSIFLAMIVAWQCHRRWSFAVETAPSGAEFGKFVAMAWIPSAVSYGVFGSIISLWPDVWPQTALIIATMFATVVSYVSLRYGVFRGSVRSIGKK